MKKFFCNPFKKVKFLNNKSYIELVNHFLLALVHLPHRFPAFAAAKYGQKRVEEIYKIAKNVEVVKVMFLLVIIC